MKRHGIINAGLAYEISRLGHTDLVVVCDAGFPVPAGPAVVDLAFCLGVPSLGTVLSGLLDEIVVEGATAAEEVRENPDVERILNDLLPEPGLVSHHELKRMSAHAKLIVRTGEATPYANVILRCGVAF